jgi:anti-sigma regulatory factor (Ser/Thr protein kinase)
VEVTQTLRLEVGTGSAVGQARRAVSEIAEQIGFDPTGVGRVAIVVTEAASNLVKHGAGGELLVQRIAQESCIGLDLLALDRGPGIRDIARATRDGFSTGGTSGTGLGAMRRNSAVHDLYTRPGNGTAIFTRLWAGAMPEAARRVEVGGINVCHPREHVSGDAFVVAEAGERAQVMVADGLGHGVGAAEASQRACDVFVREPGAGPAELLGRMHRALVSTRGAAVAIAEIDRGKELLRYSGIGNIAGTIVCSGATRSTVSVYGIVGHDARRIQEFTYPWPREALLVLHSDGISSRWNLASMPGLATRSATLIAGVLYRDFGRARDDATAVVLRGPA